MSNALLTPRNLLVPMRDGVTLAVDIVHPTSGHLGPAVLNFNRYHKDGRVGRTSVGSVHRHFAARGYAAVTADLRGLGNSGGTSPGLFAPGLFAPGLFAPGEGLDGHDLVWMRADWGPRMVA